MVLRSSMEHEDLIREMPHIERLSTQERLKLARRRRKEQLRRFLAREKDATSKRHKGAENRSQRRRQKAGRIHFVDSVMLLEAAARSDIDEVRRLLALGVDPNSTNEDGLTALHQCCIDDSAEMMTLLLDHGANVDAEDSERWTPLHAAATCGHLHLVTQLVERGANLLAVNADGNMAYDICEEDTTLEYIETQMARRGVTQELIERTRGQIEAAMLEDLKQRPISALEERVAQSATPLHIAAANGYLSVVEYLLDNHVCVDARDKDDWQPIHAAACWSHPQVIELLYQNGADLSAATRNGETPFDVCEDPEIRDRLEQLKTEQDLKRTETQRPRVRRTQSTKHSIRRTSMREKTLTPKKDVKQEARMRLGVEESIVIGARGLEPSRRRPRHAGRGENRHRDPGGRHVSDVQRQQTGGRGRRWQCRRGRGHLHTRKTGRQPSQQQGQWRSGQHRPRQRRSGQRKPSQRKPDQRRSGQRKSGQRRPSEWKQYHQQRAPAARCQHDIASEHRLRGVQQNRHSCARDGQHGRRRGRGRRRGGGRAARLRPAQLHGQLQSRPAPGHPGRPEETTRPVPLCTNRCYRTQRFPSRRAGSGGGVASAGGRVAASATATLRHRRGRPRHLGGAAREDRLLLAAVETSSGRGVD